MAYQLYTHRNKKTHSHRHIQREKKQKSFKIQTSTTINQTKLDTYREKFFQDEYTYTHTMTQSKTANKSYSISNVKD